MEKVRKRELPPGWYPSTQRDIEDFFRENNLYNDRKTLYKAGIVPHAGWFFSGSLAARVLISLDSSLDIIVVAGGHLGLYDSIRAWFCQSVETPLGNLPSAVDFLEQLTLHMDIDVDNEPDNTVEVVMPAIHYLFPNTRVVGLRVPPRADIAVHTGRLIAEIAEKSGVNVGVIGSTDLTHYGPNYRFSPKDSLPNPLKWVKQRDGKLIDALRSLNIERAVDLAVGDHSACSIGGAATAASFASASGIKEGHLIDYQTSLERHESDSFVGYAGIVF